MIVWKIFFVGKNLRPTLLNKNFHSTRVITFETFLTKLDFYFVAIREINYRPRSRETTYKNRGKNPPVKTKSQRPEIPIW